MSDKQLLEDIFKTKKRFRRILPRYLNIASLVEDDSSELVELDLSFNRWHEIPTEENNYFGIQGGILNNLVIIPSKNIQADLIYNGEIECVNAEDLSVIGEFQSYPPENPLFHSDNMTIVEKGHYRFTTKYCSNKIKDEYTAVPKRIALRIIFNRVIQAKGNDQRREGYYDFEELLKEYRATGKISGDCKAISTFTAGMIGLLGLKGRIVSGTVHEKNPELDCGHVWTEAFIPLDNEKSYWMPVDPAVEIYENFPSDTVRYSLAEIVLPSFKDQSIKTAKLKLQYI